VLDASEALLSRVPLVKMLVPLLSGYRSYWENSFFYSSGA
jgi:hypothetical protein